MKEKKRSWIVIAYYLLMVGIILGGLGFLGIRYYIDEIKVTCKDESIGYAKLNRTDATVPNGTKFKQTAGKDGNEKVCSKANGEVVSRTTTLQPVDEVNVTGTYIAPKPTVQYVPTPSYTPSYRSPTYTNCTQSYFSNNFSCTTY